MRIRSLLLVVMLGTSCLDSAVQPGPEPILTLTAVTASAPQSVEVGTAVPILPSVLVTDANGDPVAGVRVVFGTERNRGAYTVDRERTDEQGMVRVTAWTASQRAGTQLLGATTASNSAENHVVFEVTATPGPAASVGVTHDSIRLVTGLSRGPVFIANLDAYGNAIDEAEPAVLTLEDTSVASLDAGGVITGRANGRTALLVSGATVSAVVPIIVGTKAPPSILRSILFPLVINFSLAPGNVIYSVGGYSDEGYKKAAFTDTMATVYTLPRADMFDIAIIPGGSSAVTVASSARVAYAIDLATDQVTDSAVLADVSHRVVGTLDGAYALAVAPRSLSRVNLATFVTDTLVLDAVPTGTIRGVTLHPTLPYVYVTNTAGWIALVDYETMTLVQKITIGGSPRGMALTGGADSLFVARQGGALQIRDPLTLDLISDRPVVSNALDVTFSASGAQLFAVLQGVLRVYTRSGSLLLYTTPVTDAQRVTLDNSGQFALVMSPITWRVFVVQ